MHINLTCDTQFVERKLRTTTQHSLFRTRSLTRTSDIPQQYTCADKFSQTFLEILHSIKDGPLESSRYDDGQYKEITSVVNAIVNGYSVNKPLLLKQLPLALQQHGISPTLFEAWIFAIKSNTFLDALRHLNQKIVITNPFPLYIAEHIPFKLATRDSAYSLLLYLDQQIKESKTALSFRWYRVRFPLADVHHRHLWQMYNCAKCLRACLESSHYSIARETVQVACALQNSYIKASLNNEFGACSADSPSIDTIIAQGWRFLIGPITERTPYSAADMVKKQLLSEICKYIEQVPNSPITHTLMNRFFVNSHVMTTGTSKALGRMMLSRDIQPTALMLRTMLHVEAQDHNTDEVLRLSNVLSHIKTDWVGYTNQHVFLNNFYLRSLRLNPAILIDQYHKLLKPTSTSLTLSSPTTDIASKIIFFRALAKSKATSLPELLRYFEYFVTEIGHGAQEHKGKTPYFHRIPNSDNIVTPPWGWKKRYREKTFTVKSSIQTFIHIAMNSCITKANDQAQALNIWRTYSKKYDINPTSRTLKFLIRTLNRRRSIGFACAVFDHLALRKNEIVGETWRNNGDSEDPSRLIFSPYSTSLTSQIRTKDIHRWIEGVDVGDDSKMLAIKLDIVDVNDLVTLLVESSHMSEVWRVWKLSEDIWGVVPNCDTLRLVIIAALRIYQEMNAANDRNKTVFAKFSDILPTQYLGPTWDGEKPWIMAKKIFEQMLAENFPDLKYIVDPPTGRFISKTKQFLYANNVTDSQSLFRTLNQDITFQPRYPFIYPNIHLFEAYIKLVTCIGEPDDISFALGWAKALGLKPTSSFLDRAVHNFETISNHEQVSKLRLWLDIWLRDVK